MTTEPQHAAAAAPAPLAPTHAGLWLPPAGLAGCVRATLTRDTRGVALTPAQRFSHFPASPLCKLVWWLAGEGDAVEPGWPAEPGSPRTPVPDRAMFYGPGTRPVVGYSDGPVSVLMVLLTPDALRVLCGVSAADWVDRGAPLSAVLGAPWSALLPALDAAPDDPATRVALVHQRLLAAWAPCRDGADWASHRYRDWAEALALRAASSSAGRSLRQIERRIRAWAGQPMRELQSLVKAEEAFFAVAAAIERGTVQWADVAVDAGYADQSHLCRATRRVTGFSPQQLARRIAEDEGFWPYRVWL